jgi:hypothetical protein
MYTIGYTGSTGRFCQAAISSATTSVTREIVAALTFAPYTSSRWAVMSRVDMPRAYRLKIMSSTLPSRRLRLGTIPGVKLPLRSRGTSSSTGPAVVCTVLRPCPLRELPEPILAGSPTS